MDAAVGEAKRDYLIFVSACACIESPFLAGQRIIVNLDVELAKKKMRSGELAERIGITPANLSVLKTGKAKAIRFTTLDAICKELDCQPGDILEYRPDE